MADNKDTVKILKELEKAIQANDALLKRSRETAANINARLSSKAEPKDMDPTKVPAGESSGSSKRGNS